MSNKLQDSIVRLVNEWVDVNKTSVPKTYIFKMLEEEQIPATTIKASIATLIRKGFIRKSMPVSSKGVTYVRIKTIR